MEKFVIVCQNRLKVYVFCGIITACEDIVEIFWILRYYYGKYEYFDAYRNSDDGRTSHFPFCKEN